MRNDRTAGGLGRRSAMPGTCILGRCARPTRRTVNVLHDTLEKTGAEEGDIRARFGSRVATLVLAPPTMAASPRASARNAALRGQVAHAGYDAGRSQRNTASSALPALSRHYAARTAC